MNCHSNLTILSISYSSTIILFSGYCTRVLCCTHTSSTKGETKIRVLYAMGGIISDCIIEGLGGREGERINNLLDTCIIGNSALGG